MSDIAINVEKLSKRYRLGDLHRTTDSLREAITDFFRRNERTDSGRKDDNEYIWALKDISFEVERGEVLGIIGRNGAGKSTLLKILSRITEPTSGRAEINGRVGSLLEVGTGFHPELTGRENIFLSGAVLGLKRTEIERQFDEIVDFSGIERFLDTPVKRYSSGMYVRLGFAVAAHLIPDVLLVDEVLAVGDAEFQKKCLGKMNAIAGEGRTVIFISHNMASIGSLCNRLLLIDSGNISAEGDPEHVIGRYLDRNLNEISDPIVKFQKPGNQSIWIETVSLIVNGKPTRQVKMGDELTLALKLSSRQPLTKPSIGFRISSIRTGNILHANNNFLPSGSFSNIVTSGTVECELGRVPLSSDRYTISLWLGEDNNSHHQYFDSAIIFDVLESDIWGTGRMPSKQLAAMWWPTTFVFRE